MSRPLVSVIITTKNEQPVLERLLKSIVKQTYSDYEIIVVDNYSTDLTRQIAEKYTGLFFVKGPERSTQRNYGAKKSRGKYLLFLDADMELTGQVIKQCIDAVRKDKKIGQVIIPEVSVAVKFWEKVKAFERSFYFLEGDPQIEAARFFKKKIFDLVKGYDRNITGPEDWDLPERISSLGYKTARIKAQIKHHERINSPFDLARKKYYYGLKSSVYLSKNNIPLFSPKTIYLLRPVFYRNWRILVANPLNSTAMFFMLGLEQLGGGLGYLIGKVRNCK